MIAKQKSQALNLGHSITSVTGGVAQASCRQTRCPMSLTFQKAKQLRAKLLKNFPTVYLCFD
jgi:hypothetical protein